MSCASLQPCRLCAWWKPKMAVGGISLDCWLNRVFEHISNTKKAIHAWLTTHQALDDWHPPSTGGWQWYPNQGSSFKKCGFFLVAVFTTKNPTKRTFQCSESNSFFFENSVKYSDSEFGFPLMKSHEIFHECFFKNMVANEFIWRSQERVRSPPLSTPPTLIPPLYWTPKGGVVFSVTKPPKENFTEVSKKENSLVSMSLPPLPQEFSLFLWYILVYLPRLLAQWGGGRPNTRGRKWEAQQTKHRFLANAVGNVPESPMGFSSRVPQGPRPSTFTRLQPLCFLLFFVWWEAM